MLCNVYNVYGLIFNFLSIHKYCIAENPPLCNLVILWSPIFASPLVCCIGKNKEKLLTDANHAVKM